MSKLQRMTAAVLFLGTATAFAQQPAAAPQGPVGPQVGDVAPDFTLPSSTKSGIGKPVHLADLKGQVVVLAFFPKARTAG